MLAGDTLMVMVTAALRQTFDAILEQQIAALPEPLHALLEEVPLIVEDQPSRTLLREMDINPHTTSLCGLHWGTPLTDRSVTQGVGFPDRMMLFRGPILQVSGYLHTHDHQALTRQIHITLLHEIGHHFGLDEDDLAALGYG